MFFSNRISFPFLCGMFYYLLTGAYYIYYSFSYFVRPKVGNIFLTWFHNDLRNEYLNMNLDKQCIFYVIFCSYKRCNSSFALKVVNTFKIANKSQKSISYFYLIQKTMNKIKITSLSLLKPRYCLKHLSTVHSKWITLCVLKICNLLYNVLTRNTRITRQQRNIT